MTSPIRRPHWIWIDQMSPNAVVVGVQLVEAAGCSLGRSAPAGPSSVNGRGFLNDVAPP